MNFLNNIFDNINNNNNNIRGLNNELKVQYIKYLYARTEKNIIVLTASLYEATKIYNLLTTYINNVLFFPMDDFLTSVAIAISPELEIKRIETLNKINYNSKNIIVTNLTGFLKFLPKKETLKNFKLNLATNSEIKRDNLIKSLTTLGYTETSLVTSSGEFSIRGFILDLFPYNIDNPVRLELFGNLIESIRQFDIESQLSISNVSKIEILPYKEIIPETDNNNSLYDLLDAPLIIKISPEIIEQTNIMLEQQINDYNKSKNISNDIKYMYNYRNLIINDEVNLADFNNDNSYIEILCNEIDSFNGNYEILKTYLEKNYLKYTIILCIENAKIISLIKEYLDNNIINTTGIMHNKINILFEKINNGFIINNYIVIGLNDIEKTNIKLKYFNPVKIGKKIKNFNEIKNGDYVVHIIHGIGIYGGLIKLTKNNIEKDYILIKYAGSDKVYIPVENINSIFKYMDSEGSKPKINKLNSTAWIKTKNYVRKKIKDISEQLLKLYATRATLKKEKYQEFPEEILFANDFEFIPTKDQYKCIEEVLNDLKKDKIMDRLICGDVGFGKTEIAFRAIFNTIMNGYQTAYLCPTTILSKQQYDKAIIRFKNFPINIELVNRYTSVKKFEKIVNDLKNGKIDLLFGTHKLFNKKIEYKNLGLLIIDEEQRFGVTQKEKIKEISKNVNVLTLSATPIPRTLKMAMSGLKDLSILDTAPEHRYPVQTYVIEKNDLLIKDAIYKELSRNGQIFYLFNNINKLEFETERLKKLVPEAKICYAHGKMTKLEIETIMQDFIDFKYDILVCTTIIETGIDIPNVNTLIVSDAHKYGLSQLYQLRGRVGRSREIAYAYLTYDPSKILNELATKRLKSIKEFTELGSGYKIAMRDLAIRGAGDLLGREQAGFINSIGIELYTQMVKETIAEIQGKAIPLKEELSEYNEFLNIKTHISNKYVKDESIRIEIHKLISKIEDYDSLLIVKNEIEDRFGKIDSDIEIYMFKKLFERTVNKLGIRKVIQTKDKIEIEIPENILNNVNEERLFLKIYNINNKFKLKNHNKRLIISLPLFNLKNHYIYYLISLLDIIKESRE